MDVKAAFTGKDRKAILNSCEYGEDQALDSGYVILEDEDFEAADVEKTKTKEMDMANKLVEQLTEKFSIEKYKDTYTDKLLKRIKAKSKGKKIAVPKKKVEHKDNDSLMNMLKASLKVKKSCSANKMEHSSNVQIM